MTDTSVRTASAAYLTGVYLLSLLGWTALTLLVIFGVEAAFGMEFTNSAMGLILVMGAAMTAGHFWYRREKARPASSRMWKIAPLCGLLTLAVQLVLVLLVMSVEGVSLVKEVQRDGPLFAAGVLAGLLLVNVLFIRFGFGMSTKQADKQAKLQAERLATRQAAGS